MTHPHKPSDFRHQDRKDRLIREREHDPYHPKTKPPEPTRCPECGAVYHAGRWQWIEAPAGADETPCPACRRIHDHVPAGWLTLAGPYVEAHRDAVMQVVHHVEAREKAQHPLERIMDVAGERGKVVITFTGAHLARAAGEALHHALQGELDFHYVDEDAALRVTWRR